MGSYRGVEGAGDYTANALKGMARFNEFSDRNALDMEGKTQDIDIKDRQEKMKRIWIMGKAFEQAKDQKTYDAAVGLRKELFGDPGTVEGADEIPKEYDPKFIDKMKFRSNVMYDFFSKHKESYVPKSEEEWKDIEREAGIKRKDKDAAKKGSTRTYQKEGRTITEEHDGENWNELGSGPKWNPKTDQKDATDKNSRLYISSMNQVLKEYGGGADPFIRGENNEIIGLSQGGTKAYQDMTQKAKTGDRKAKTDLATYDSLKQKLLGLTDEGQATDTANALSWKNWQK